MGGRSTTETDEAAIRALVALMQCSGIEKTGVRIALEFRLTVGLGKIGASGRSSMSITRFQPAEPAAYGGH